MSERLKGIRRTARGWRVYGRVHGRFFSKSYPKDTALKVMKDWRAEQRVKIREKQLAGTIEEAPPGTLAGDVARYLVIVQAMPGLDQRAFELARWVDAFGTDRVRKAITAAEILAVMHQWRIDGLAGSTCNRRRTALLHLWNRLDGKSAKNPVRDVSEFPEGKPEPRGRVYPLLARIFAAMDPTKTRARLKLIAYVGLRHGEIKKLTSEDWRRADGTLLVHGIHKGRGTPVRLLKLTAKGELALKEFARLETWGWFSNSSLHARWTAAIARVNIRAATLAKKRGRPAPDPISHIRPYDLRHSLGTEIYRLTKDLKAVKEYLGHTSLKTTERYMAGAVSDGIAHAAAAFDQVHGRAAKVLPLRRQQRA